MVDPACLVYRAQGSRLHGQPCLSLDPNRSDRLDLKPSRNMAVLSKSRQRNKFSRHHLVDWQELEMKHSPPPTDGYMEGDTSSNNLSSSETDKSQGDQQSQGRSGDDLKRTPHVHCAGIVGFRYHCNGDERVETKEGPWRDRRRERRLVKNIRDKILKSAYSHTTDQHGDYVANPNPPEPTWLEKHPPRGLLEESSSRNEGHRSFLNKNTTNNNPDNLKSILNLRKNTTNNHPGDTSHSHQQVEIQLDHKAGVLKRRVSQYKTPIEKNADTFLQQSFKIVRKVSKAMKSMEQDGAHSSSVLLQSPKGPGGSKLYRTSGPEGSPSGPGCPVGKFHPGVNSSVMRHRKPWLDYHLKKEMTNMHQNKLQMKKYLDSVKQTKEQCQLVKEGIMPLRQSSPERKLGKTGQHKNVSPFSKSPESINNVTDTIKSKISSGKQNSHDFLNLKIVDANEDKLDDQAVKNELRKLSKLSANTRSPIRQHKLVNQIFKPDSPRTSYRLDNQTMNTGSQARACRKCRVDTRQVTKIGTSSRPRKLD